VALANRIVHSVFALLFTFCGVAGLYALLHADFLAGAQLLIYVGGILVLLLFGVMLTQTIDTVGVSRVSMQRAPAAVVCLLLFAVQMVVIYTTSWETREQPLEQTTAALGTHLMTDYLLPFEVISVILLGVLVAAAMMARKETRS
jgi:NADH:ubiquinone oxidoreductase subunit 6 (subunit J)